MMVMDWSTDKNILDEMLIFFIGKNIGILGPDASGKSVLYTLILERKIEETSGATDARESSKAINITFKDDKDSKQCLRIKLILDVGGHRLNFNQKKDTFNSQEYIIYLLRSDFVMPNDKQIVERNIKYKYELAIQQDFYNIDTWEGKNRKLIIVGNHFGQPKDGKKVKIPYQGESFVPNFLDKSIKADYQREFRSVVTKMVRLNKFADVKWVVGSLVSEQLGNQLALDIFRCLV
ncbi:MAG: hypothetical protein WA919_15050 [Coleofasciculaceae cyanobacterium]